MTMISYAQNAEDVRLRRVFADRNTGFYIDVGAYDPVSCSITKHFYDLGWRGLNLEPSPTSFARVAQARPRDTTLNVGIADRPGTMTFYESQADAAGLSTFAAAEVERHRAAGFRFTERQVPVTTLAAVCDAHAPERIDFMSIDVEGFEREVIAGGDFRRHRPVVVVVEATEPKRTTASHDRWEHLLLDADYAFATFDGLNRYYVRREDAELAPLLAVPVSVFDDFVPWPYQQWLDELSQLRREETPFVRQMKRFERFWRAHVTTRVERLMRRP